MKKQKKKKEEEKMRKKLKSTKGITLIALVITIIVLLILAGVSIAMLTGENGILTKAQDAKQETEQAQIEEQIKLKLTEDIINQYTGEEDIAKSDYIRGIYSQEVLVDTNKVLIDCIIEIEEAYYRTTITINGQNVAVEEVEKVETIEDMAKPLYNIMEQKNYDGIEILEQNENYIIIRYNQVEYIIRIIDTSTYMKIYISVYNKEISNKWKNVHVDMGTAIGIDENNNLVCWEAGTERYLQVNEAHKTIIKEINGENISKIISSNLIIGENGKVLYIIENNYNGIKIYPITIENNTNIISVIILNRDMFALTDDGKIWYISSSNTHECLNDTIDIYKNNEFVKMYDEGILEDKNGDLWILSKINYSDLKIEMPQEKIKIKEIENDLILTEDNQLYGLSNGKLIKLEEEFKLKDISYYKYPNSGYNEEVWIANDINSNGYTIDIGNRKKTINIENNKIYKIINNFIQDDKGNIWKVSQGKIATRDIIPDFEFEVSKIIDGTDKRWKEISGNNEAFIGITEDGELLEYGYFYSK